jgi:hypothetical protein
MRVAFLLVLAACDDTLDQRLAIVDEPRVLAIVSEPAEAKPGATASYRAIVGGPDGPILAPPAWAYCRAPKPPTEDNVVSTGCLDAGQLVALGSGEVTGTLPMDGCIRYGPDVPPGGFRPRDPDPTGGYYQPVRLDVDALLAFGSTRITCNLPTAPFEVAIRYNNEYVANQNPTLLPFDLATAPANTDVTLVAAWPAEAVESFLYFDARTQTLVDRREAMRVSWFATAGSIPVDASAVDERGTQTRVETTWHTPGPGRATLWIVLRDSRGGIATQTITVEIQ